MIKAVFLDVDNTLLDFGKCSRSSIKKAMAEYGREYSEDMYPVFHRRNVALWEALERGEIDLAELYRIRWNIIFAELGIDLDGVAFEDRFCHHLAESSDIVEGAVELCRYLAGKYPVYIASNAPHSQQVKRLTAAGLAPYITEIFTSEQIGFSKPDVRFFEGCFAQLPGLKPENIVFIGDSLTADIAGGIACGMKTLWFDYAETGKESPATWTVQSLNEIENYI